jgi:hypothetical protein
MVTIAFIRSSRSMLQFLQNLPKWKLDVVGKEEIEKEATYITVYCCLTILVGLCTAVLYVVPSEGDYETFFIMTWFEEHVLEWADVLSLLHRLSFPFASFLMQAPCLQMCYMLKHSQFQVKILMQYIDNLDSGYEDSDMEQLIFDENYQNEMERRLTFCIKRHIEIFVTCRKIVKAGSLFVFLFTTSGGLLGISILMYIVLVRISCVGVLRTVKIIA